MKIVAAFDSFKGSLSAQDIVTIVGKAVRTTLPNATITELPLADGGEGTTEALAHYLNASWQICNAHDALMRPITTKYAISSNGTTAIMDMASAAGLTLLSSEERNPMLTTTFGVGEMLKDAISKGCKHILLGIGGSATNDAGIGMLAALGVKFYDNHKREVTPIGKNLKLISSVDLSKIINLKTITIDVICDVTNPLYGPNGAAHIYAKQKGANSTEIIELDNGLRHFATLCTTNPNTSGAGAAGGLGYALLSLNANLKNGAEIVLETAQLAHHIQDADLIFTGEGKIDEQTLCGKLPFAVLQMAKHIQKPVIALAGCVENKDKLLTAGFKDVQSINALYNPNVPITELMKTSVAAENLYNTVVLILDKYSQ
ncbi:glycerate kinase [Prevotella bivia DNF00320]|uniref:Glycerate kinase n=2 Tax=Prevotella bivia TaxID=28125 RepID=I4ZBQ4_9BACT|nr:glycerate kinase [Prevotella bivia]EFB92752.1 glycerate kinase [Prevotella bivia JCVIHMP010]EIM33646.1 glycerate kinase [Prevotella bivia DSM 20514]KGF43684.1 glycerate kinase [Prevotella bivia DNF00320]